MIATLLLAAQVVSTVPCTTPQPAPTAGLEWVCQGGGWVPVTPQPGPAPTPAPAPVPPTGAREPLVLAFQVGKTYKRPATGAVIYIMGLGPLRNGLAVYVAECQNTVSADQCWYPGAGRFILATASAEGWEEVN